MSVSTVKTQASPKVDDFKIINNKYTQARGKPRMYEITCGKCQKLVLIYQKDGPGRLVRCYLDRIHYPESLPDKEKLACQSCKNLIGTKMIYKPENRPAFRMIRDAYQIG